MALSARIKLLMATLAFTAGTFAAGPANAYPDQPIRLVVPYGAGSATDILARQVGESLGKSLNKAVIVENRPGASGSIAATYVARAPSDGYTLLFGTTQVITVNPYLIKDLAYDPQNDFTPVARLFNVGTVLVTSPKLSVQSLDELLAHIRSFPAKSSFGSTGFGTAAHLPGAYLAKLEKLEITHVPYTNSGQMMTDVIRGEVTLLFYPPQGVKGFIDSGEMKPLAWTGTNRSAQFPDVPTMQELGYDDFLFGAWYGVFAPQGTPAEIITQLSAELKKVTQDEKVVNSVERSGAEVDYAPASEMDTFLKNESERFSHITSVIGPDE